MSSSAVLSGDLLRRIQAVAAGSPTIATISNGMPNRILDVGPDGVLVETNRSIAKGAGPRLVPARLILDDWSVLVASGSLDHLRASHRGSFTCALFARFPDVRVTSTRPIRLELETSTRRPG